MKKLLLIIILILSSALLVNFTDNYFSNTTSVYISKQADNLASNAVKDIINKTVVPKINMQEILTIKYNQNKVESVIVNTKIVNQIMGDASELVDELLNTEYLEKELSELYLPIGMLISDSILSSYGPKIKIKIKPIGAYSADVYTDISTFGINNSLIEVYLNIVIDIVALIPLQHQNIKTETKIYLISQVVQGTVPNYYYGNGVNVDYIPDNN